MKKPTYLLFVDLTAAFDHVVRKWMFQSIYQRLPPGEDTTLIELLEALYTYTTTALAETPDDVYELFLGVRQGVQSHHHFTICLWIVMGIFMEACEKREIKFLRLNYRIRSTATTREDRAKLTSGNSLHGLGRIC